MITTYAAVPDSAMPIYGGDHGRNITCPEAIFLFDLVGWFVAHDVIRNEWNFQKSEITPLESRPVLDGRRQINGHCLVTE